MALFCIVTVHDNTNCGSFLQAWALGYSIRRLGHDVIYLKKNSHSGISYNPTVSYIKKIIKKLLKLDFKGAISIRKQYNEFKFCRHVFPLTDIKNLDNVDCIILGSDTIWNVETEYFKKLRNIYWGVEFEEKHIITYACSVANTSLQIIKNYPELEKCSRKWEYISVRDESTKYIISSMTDKKVYMVCDPTMLLTKKDYVKLVDKADVNNKYILLYLFESLSEKQEYELRRFADNNKLLIISGTNRKDSISNRKIALSPLKFVQYMLYANYVITDTFHGSVFSVNLNKQFVVIGRAKKKVNDFLQRVEFTDRIVAENQSVLSVMNKRIDYEKYKEVIENFRKSSLDFLETAVNEVSNGNKKE